MRNDKWISSGYVLGSVINGFGLNVAGLKYDIIEWIGQGIQGIGYVTGFVENSEVLTVKNHKAGFPCDFFRLSCLIKEGKRLRYGDRKYATPSKNVIEDIALKELLQQIDVKQQLYESVLPEKAELIAQVQQNIRELSYQLNWSVIREDEHDYYLINQYGFKFSFEEGEVLIVYKAFYFDDDGYPMIVDSYKYIEALRWFVMKSLLERGYKHNTIDLNYAEQMWIKFKHQAANEAKTMTEDEMINFKENWTNQLFHIQQSGTWYNN